jgi:PAS domain S-box-containing protein
MKSPDRHISISSKIFALLGFVSAAAFLGVLWLISLDRFDQPLDVLLLSGGLLTLVSASLLAGVWKLVLVPVSRLAGKLARFRPPDNSNQTQGPAVTFSDSGSLDFIETISLELASAVEEGALAVKRQEALFAQVQSNSIEMSCRMDGEGTLLLCDPGLAAMLGYSTTEELKSKAGSDLANIVEDPELAAEIIRLLNKGREIVEHSVKLTHREGGQVFVDLRARAIRDHTNTALYYQVNLSDVSRLGNLAEELDRNRHFQNLFSYWIDLLLRDEDEAVLTTDFCRMLVEKGGYPLAWTGVAIEDDNKSIRPLAVYGHNMGFVHGMPRSWSINNIEQAPAGKAIRTGMPSVVRDVQSIEALKSRRAEYAERGVNSVLAVPMRVDNTSNGVLVVYSGSNTAFGEQEIKWIVDLASSLSIGVTQLRDRKTRQRAEKERSRAEQNYRAIFDNAVEGMIQLSSDQQIINANIAATRIFGFDSIEDLLRQGDRIGRDLLVRQAKQKALQGLKVDSSGSGRVEISWFRNDNKQIWLSINLHPNYDSTGRIVRYDGIIDDVTEERQTESDLRKLSRAVEQSPVAVVITDIGGNIEYVNNKFTAVSGYERDEVIGKKPNILKSGHTTDEEYKELWRRVSGGDEWQGEFHNRKKTGELFWEAAAISPIRDTDGRITHYLAIKEDITEAKAADEAYRQTGAHLETILNNVLEGIISADENGRITGFNAAAEAMFGYSSAEAVGLDINVLAGEGALGELHKRIIDSFKFEENSPYIGHTIEVLCRRRDGTGIPLELSVGIALTQNSKVFLGTYRDISERKEIEHERHQLSERLMNSQKLESIGQLAGGIAHDFNNILTPIVGYVELAKRNVEEETQVHKDLLRIERSARRARELTTKILAYSRPAPSEIQKTDFAEIVSEAVDMIRIAAGSTIEVKLVNETNSATIFGDPSQLSQVIMNLVTNAQQAMADDGGRITVSLKNIREKDRSKLDALKYQAGKFIRLTVEDTGPGMDQETRSMIFEPFFTTKSTGTGLGMATVLNIVNHLNGAVEIESEPGQGTRVEVYLPLSDSEEMQDPEVEAGSDLISGDEHILFVDDEPEHTDLAQRMLEYFGYRVTPMVDSEQALEAFRANPDSFDIVITDQMMPRISGHELALAMWEIRPNLPIVAISGYSKNVSEQNARKLGYRDFLAKPFELKSLVTIVRRSLDNQSRHSSQ